VYCLVEVPGNYKTLTFEEIEKNDFKYDYQILKEPSFIKATLVESQPSNLSRNLFYISEGNWSLPKHLIGETSCHSNIYVLQVQCRLNDKGYSLEPNNFLDKATKEALIDYQKKNGLPVGTLNFETLKKLEIGGY